MSPAWRFRGPAAIELRRTHHGEIVAAVRNGDPVVANDGGDGELLTTVQPHRPGDSGAVKLRFMSTATMTTTPRPSAPANPFGGLLREWRQTRHVSQLELSSVSGVSTRHLSFIETGRAKPSRDMVLRLAQELEVPLREQNTLLTAAGYAPEYTERALDDPEMAPVRKAIELVLDGHLPYPAFVLDSRSNILRANKAAGIFTEGVADHLLRGGGNAVRLALHPDGLAPRLVNHAEVREHLLHAFRRRAAAGGDPRLAKLLKEFEAYPHPGRDESASRESYGDVVTPIRLEREGRVLSFFSTIATFGTAVDLTVAELSLESFFPADGETAEILRELS
jgi:transcriptional regulator with XRE-family HTH domain